MSVPSFTNGEPSGPAEVRISQKFNAPDSDISYQSSDNAHFLVHSKNLRATAIGFPLQSENPVNTAILLPETETVLEALFRFCYPERHPDLSTLEFEALVPIAKAAEKYKVFAAMNVCSIRMKRTLPQHATEVLEYAAKNDYHQILEGAAQLVMDASLPTVLPLLPSNLVVPWVLHREKYVNVLKRAILYFHTQISEQDQRGCPMCGASLGEPVKQVFQIFLSEKSLWALFNLDSVFGSGHCGCGRVPKVFTVWREAIEADLRSVTAFGCA